MNIYNVSSDVKLNINVMNIALTFLSSSHNYILKNIIIKNKNSQVKTYYTYTKYDKRNDVFDIEDIIIYDEKLLLYCIKIFYFNNNEPKIFSLCAKHEKLYIKKLLLKKKFKYDTNTFSNAAENGHLNIMKWLLEKNFPFDKCAFSSAIKHGNLDNIKWLFEKNFPYSEFSFAAAAERGNLEVMKWLFEHNIPFDDYTFANAAKKGDLTNLKWLQEKNFPFNEYTFDMAFLNGNIENMKWLYDNNFPYSERVSNHLIELGIKKEEKKPPDINIHNYNNYTMQFENSYNNYNNHLLYERPKRKFLDQNMFLRIR